jgi:DNA-binding transcriptional ArsR family regulator
MPYEPKIDEMIIRVLCKAKEIGFNKMTKKAQITSRVASRHLDLLENQGIIVRDKRDDWKIGTKRPCRLSNNTRLALELKLPIKVKRGKKEYFLLLPKEQSGINQKTYLLLIQLITINFRVPEPVKVLSDVRLGDIYIKGKPIDSFNCQVSVQMICFINIETVQMAGGLNTFNLRMF